MTPARRQHRLALAVAAASCLLTPAQAQQADPFAALTQESRPLATRLETDMTGGVQLGASYTSDDNWMFGQYNGLHEKGANFLGNLYWQDFSNSQSQWQVSADNLGLETREGFLTWGRHGGLQLEVGLDSQLQVRNNSGRTPFSGDDVLILPGDWVTGGNTGDFATLNASLRQFDREVARDKLNLGLTLPFAGDWQLGLAARYEDKQGTSDAGASIYVDAEGGQAALLPLPVDQRTTEFDISLGYAGTRLQLDGLLFYSDFDNREELLQWQNPYSMWFDPAVDYPNGYGGLGQAPDNEQTGGRLTGQYLLSQTTRLQVDASYTVTEQDQSFLDYTVNPNLAIYEPAPRDSLGGEVAEGLFNAALVGRAGPKLRLEARLKVRDRDYSAPRDGYRYVPGDGGDQSRSALSVYNTRHDINWLSLGLEGSYRLPLRSRLYLEYEYEEIERENAAVEKTEENTGRARYRIAPWQWFSANGEIAYGDRAASTYHWDQSYYATLDTALINSTPDNQRYLNHPAFSQYYLSNRERLEGKLDLGFTPNPFWSINLNLLWRDDDYDKTELGLNENQQQRYHLTASYSPGASLSFSAWAGYDRLDYTQTGRSFRGGQEKDAFDIYPPLPQASDPGRNWILDSRDESVTAGIGSSWSPDEDWQFKLDYNFVDTQADQAYSGQSTDLDAGPLPTVETHLHHITAAGIWQLRDNLSLQLDYQYYRYKSDDWARNGVAPDSIDRVLSFGERNPNEQIHYVGTSVWYRWK